MSADAYTALPIYALGNEYFAMSYIYKGSSSIRQGPSELGLIAVYDSTRIEIILPWDGFVISFPGYDVRRSGRQLSLRLNRFETYQVSSDGIKLIKHTSTHIRLEHTGVSHDQHLLIAHAQYFSDYSLSDAANNGTCRKCPHHLQVGLL